MFYQKHAYKNDWRGKLILDESISSQNTEPNKLEVQNKIDKTYLKRYMEVSFPNKNGWE